MNINQVIYAFLILYFAGQCFLKAVRTMSLGLRILNLCPLLSHFLFDTN